MQEWMNKLAGKTLTDQPSSETVSVCSLLGKAFDNSTADSPSPSQKSFCKKDLPKATRVIEPGMMVTRDFKPDRLNVHVKEDGTVSHVSQG